jgi:hypothetical protein
MVQVTVNVSQTELDQIIGKKHPQNTEFAQALAQSIIDRFLNVEYVDLDAIKDWFNRHKKDGKISEEEIMDRVNEILSNVISDTDFVEEINRILGTTYTIDDIEWKD